MENLKEYLSHEVDNKDKKLSFIDYFYKLMNKKSLNNSDVYNAVNMSRQTYSKIINQEVTPTLKNAIKLAIGLRCSNEECKLLLKKCNYTLSSYSKFNLIIRYCLDNKIYNIVKINELLYQECQESLDD